MIKKILGIFKKEDDSKKMSVISLSKLAEQRAPSTLKFKGDSNQFLTMIIKATSEELILDDLVPPPSKQYTKGAWFRLTSNDNGVAVTFKSQITDSRIEDGHKVYIAEIPEEIEYLQRRDNYRIKLGSTFDTKVKCFFSNREMELRIKDISASGIAFICDKADEALFNIRDTIHGCELELDDGEIIFFDFMVYRIKPLPKSSNICGRIIYKDAEHKSQLTKYITKIDREIRRKETKHKHDDLDIELLDEYEKNISRD